MIEILAIWELKIKPTQIVEFKKGKIKLRVELNYEWNALLDIVLVIQNS